MVIEALPRRAAARNESNARFLREQDRREASSASDGRLVGRTPGVEQLDQLLAGAVVVPFAVAPDDLQQVIERLLALALGVQRDRQVEARLVVARIGGDLLLQLADRPERGGLLGELERRARGRHRRLAALGL